MYAGIITVSLSIVSSFSRQGGSEGLGGKRGVILPHIMQSKLAVTG